MTNPDDDLTDAERQAYALANHLKVARGEADRWATLAERCDGDPGEFAAAYRDAWQAVAAEREAELKDLNAQIGFLEGGDE